MATKPTVRIPLWASTGTKTDPGGSKEAAGWLVDERPPANWWNFIWNAIGQWLGYFEDATDETNTALVATQTRVAKILATIKCNSGSTPTADWDPYSEIASLAISGNDIVVNVGGLFNHVDQMVAFAYIEANANYVCVTNAVDTNTLWISAIHNDGTVLNLGGTGVQIKLVVFGTPYS